MLSEPGDGSETILTDKTAAARGDCLGQFGKKVLNGLVRAGMRRERQARLRAGRRQPVANLGLGNEGENGDGAERGMSGSMRRELAQPGETFDFVR